MREYKITKGNLGYHVFREKDWVKEWLQNNSCTLDRNHAKTFYHLDSAISALTIFRARWNTIELDSLQEKRESEEKLEKTSWSEL